MKAIDSSKLKIALPDTEFQFKHFGKEYNTIVIGLHGWTGDEHSLIPISIGVRCPNSLWILPRAPFETQKKSKGFSWYDKPPTSYKEIVYPIKIIENVVDYFRTENGNEIKIFLLGFSQGAALSAGAGLYLKSKIDGVISIAGFIREDSIKLMGIKPNNNYCPLLIMHGNKDEIVPIESGIELKNICSELGQEVEFITYDENHKIPVSAMKIIRNFILK